MMKGSKMEIFWRCIWACYEVKGKNVKNKKKIDMKSTAIHNFKLAMWKFLANFISYE